MTLLDQVELELTAWASWTISAAGPGCLGYAKRTTLGRLMDEGPTGAGDNSFAPRSEEMPERVYRVEMAIIALPDKQKKAIKLKYLNISLRDQDRAKALHMSYDGYKREIERARWFIGGRLF